MSARSFLLHPAAPRQSLFAKFLKLLLPFGRQYAPEKFTLSVVPPPDAALYAKKAQVDGLVWFVHPNRQFLQPARILSVLPNQTLDIEVFESSSVINKVAGGVMEGVPLQQVRLGAPQCDVLANTSLRELLFDLQWVWPEHVSGDTAPVLECDGQEVSDDDMELYGVRKCFDGKMVVRIGNEDVPVVFDPLHPDDKK
eukprot:TRINITY_DN9060_c0_g1_i1.p1 TRINITY_DN9060_c0_g1~~TRINITY_DN9060_c0_g1_i1.p1  ORF type:complete len:197 (+),score=47.10 TRINITY_DN9060_c0_g1_i1:67-657(+)